ncbi:E3 ubiquitin-protein ligase PPP1R11-like [Onychomys torridus]|uniref:E3 ubiquitin-protein ligase PPP1R11-like n=1 Tax=Onychomys torridus TaxID=38674 RepID=UPI00167F5B4F|nr:E3 ubiquitin-protein ligase PPP1R11-like [Onychomys torridus]
MEESASKLTEAVQEPTVVLKDELKNSSLSKPLEKSKSCKRVEWSSDTVDNEHLGRRSSKCCVYEKPRAFGESSSESENEDNDNGDVLCARGHQKRRCVLSNTVARTSSPKPKDPPESLPSPING